MIAIYTYHDKVIRYTDVDMIREQFSLVNRHILLLKNGKYVSPKEGWISHEVKVEKESRRIGRDAD